MSSSGSCSGKLRVNLAQSLDSNPRIPVSSLRLEMGTLGMVPAPWPRAAVLNPQDMQREVMPQRHPKWTLLEVFMKFMTNWHQPQREKSLRIWRRQYPVLTCRFLGGSPRPSFLPFFSNFASRSSTQTGELGSCFYRSNDNSSAPLLRMSGIVRFNLIFITHRHIAITHALQVLTHI